MSERATCWSITINNPTEEDEKPQLPSGWRFAGQLERGEEGTLHIQGILHTPQVRFSAVKRVFPRAHIEKAYNEGGLAKYVHKEDTRVREIQQSVGLTAFALQDKVIERWDDTRFLEYQILMKYQDDCYLRYADIIVRNLISEGLAGGVEFVAINPMWRTSWKKFGEAIVNRAKNKITTSSINDGQVPMVG